MMRRLLGVFGRRPTPKATDTRRPCPNARCLNCGGRYANHPEARAGEQQDGETETP